MKYVKLTSEILGLTCEFFRKENFLQILPVISAPITDPLGPDPASSVIKTAMFEYYGQELSITQSMILHKQIAISKGIDKLFVLSPNLRLEHKDRSKTKKHLFEFSQLDFEIANAKKEDVFFIMEKFLKKISRELEKSDNVDELGLGIEKIKGPFKRYTTFELIEKYGKDWEMKASLDHDSPFWAISHKREFYDREDEEKKDFFHNFDLIYPRGFCEALSGGEREYTYDRLLYRLKRDKMVSRYKSYLEFAKKSGFLPSCGGGFGMERLVRFICGTNHVGDVQLFRRVPGKRVFV